MPKVNEWEGYEILPVAKVVLEFHVVSSTRFASLQNKERKIIPFQLDKLYYECISLIEDSS